MKFYKERKMSKKKTKKSSELRPAKQPTKLPLKKWHKILIAIFLFLAIPLGAVLAFEEMFEEKIYPGIKIGDLSLGGKTKGEALVALEKSTQFLSEEGLTFAYQGEKISLLPVMTAANDPDLSRTLFFIENKKTVAEAFTLGRDDKFLNNLKNQLNFLLHGKKINLKYQFNTNDIEKILKENFGSWEQPPENAKLQITSNADKEALVKVLPEKSGVVFDYKTAISAAFQNVSDLKNEPVFLNLISEEPKIKKTDALLTEDRTKNLADLCSATFGESKKTWTIAQNQLRDWLEFQMSADGVTVGFNKEKVEEYLTAIAEDINVAPQDAKFQVESGAVKEFKIHQGGKELDLDASYTAINNFILNLTEEKVSASCKKTQTADDVINLIVKITAPQIPIGSVNNLGIKELVGRGVSNFAGSPVNRRHNIKVGAAKLNGVLIAPGEEFSLNKTLGDISGATGYLPELVIKGNKTVPEFGGGLCQIATTMFRVALDAGAPIIERRAHTYRVVYYEPAGIDATIYSPSPDFKFLNDTPAYLLLQTKIEGDELTFELWGTSDGRKVNFEGQNATNNLEELKPKIFNITSPGPTKIVETEDLPPGEKKCTERAHAGADAEFSRAVTLASGEVRTDTWKSHYVPWPAVCLVGKAAAPSPEGESPPPAEGTLPASETPPETTLPATNTNTAF
jgi:vancomycin resistance protein YoaR